MPPFRGVPGGERTPVPGGGMKIPFRWKEKGTRPVEERIEKDQISSTGIGPARVSRMSEAFPQGRSDSPRRPSRGSGIRPLVAFSPSTHRTRSRGEGRRPRRSQATKTHRTALRDGFPRGGAGRSEEPSDHVTHEGGRITDGLSICSQATN